MKTTNRIKQLFEERKPNQKIMGLFLTAGYPEPAHTLPLLDILSSSGADMIELGMPFSDPLADGPTIQHASNIAIEQGVHIDQIFDMVKSFREKNETPLLLMGYLNPVYRYGIKPFLKKAAESGVDGLIFPDLPPNEMPEIETCCKKFGLSLVFLVAPNTSESRMKEIDNASNGFVYCVSVKGVTGVRKGSEISESIDSYIHDVKANIKKNPIMIGFGIRSHEDAMAISKNCDGYIAGSALIDFIQKTYPQNNWLTKTASFVKKLKTGKDIP